MRKLIVLSSSLLLALCGALSAHADSCNGVSASANLITNCGFETGDFTGWSGTALSSAYDPNYVGVDNGDPYTAQTTPYQGTYEAYLGVPSTTASLTQTFATNIGAPYIVTFALLNDTSPSTGYNNSFAVLFGSNTLFSETDALAGAYMLYTVGGIATSATTTLSFVSENDGGYFELDSVSVAATPEPSTFVLLGSGLVGLAGLARRRLFRQA